MKKLLILGAGEMQVPVIEKAKDMGLFTIVADYDPMAPGMALADKQITVSTNDYEALIAIATAEKIDGCITTSDFPVNCVAKISEKLNLKAMTPKVAKICTNKFLQRELFQKNNIRVPLFALCNNINDLQQFEQYPLIVKPVDSSASRGVKKVHSYTELTEAFNEALKFSISKQVIVEQFIQGKEYSVETLTQDNNTTIVTITEKLVRGDNYFVEDTHIQYARISDAETELIETEVINAIKALNANNCPTHTEIKIENGKVFIIEIACRLGGDYIASDLVPLSTGIDMLNNLILIATGQKIDANRKFNKCSAVQFINETNYNYCKIFLANMPETVKKHCIKPYSKSEIKNSLDRLGHIILQTNTIEQMEKILAELN